MTNDNFEASKTGNWSLKSPFAICWLDKLSRNENVQGELSMTVGDLVVCDEADKMTAHFFGGDVRYTKKLGQLISSLRRHLRNSNLLRTEMWKFLWLPMRREKESTCSGPISW